MVWLYRTQGHTAPVNKLRTVINQLHEATKSLMILCKIQIIRMNPGPGARPTNAISFEFEIRSKLGALWFKIGSIDHNEILHTSQQCNCRDVCKISLWSLEYILNQITAKFCRISNSIEIPFVGWAPGLVAVEQWWMNDLIMQNTGSHCSSQQALNSHKANMRQPKHNSV